MQQLARAETYLAWPEARPLLGNISRTTAWKGAREGWLPAPKVISPNRRAYALSEILAWQASKASPQAATARTPQGSRTPELEVA